AHWPGIIDEESLWLKNHFRGKNSRSMTVPPFQPLSVEVPLGDRSYRVLIGAGLLGRLAGEFSAFGFGKKCAIITDGNVGPLYAEAVAEPLRAAGYTPTVITVPAG